jgi:hypothetical protein
MAVLAAALVGLGSAARAEVVAIHAGVAAGGTYSDIPLVAIGGGQYAIGVQNGDQINPWVWQTADFRLELSGAMNQDPSILTSVTVTDFGAPTTFIFSWLTPIVPTGPSSQVRSSIGAVFTEGTSGTPFLFTPANTNAPGFALSSSLSDGVDTVNPTPGLNIGPAFSAGPMPIGTQYTGYSYASGTLGGPNGTYTTLGMTLGFSLDGGGDVASVNVFTEIVPTPLPAGAPLVLSALGLLAGAARRRRAAQHPA